MIVRKGKPGEVHRWFVAGETDELVLCMFLCRNVKQVDILKETIDRAFEIDSIIGDKIGFLFISNDATDLVEIDEGTGHAILVPGGVNKKDELSGKSLSVRKFVNKFDLDRFRKSDYWADKEHYKIASEILAKETANIVPEYCEYFNINSSQLPGMLVLYKGFEEVQYFEFMDDNNADRLISFFRTLVNISESIERELLGKDLYTYEIADILNEFDDASNEVSSKEEKLEKALIGLCSKYNIKTNDYLRLKGAFFSSSVSSEMRDSIVNEMVSKVPASAKDGRWGKAAKLSNRIQEIREKASFVLSSRRSTDIKEKIIEEQSKIDTLRNRMENFKSKWGGSTARSKRLDFYDIRIYDGFWEKATRINTAWGLSEKAEKVLAFLSKFSS